MLQIHLQVLDGKVLAQDAIGHCGCNTLVMLFTLHKDLCQPCPACSPSQLGIFMRTQTINRQGKSHFLILQGIAH